MENYPLVNVYITMENHHFSWANQLLMAMVNSLLYVYQRVTPQMSRTRGWKAHHHQWNSADGRGLPDFEQKSRVSKPERLGKKLGFHWVLTTKTDELENNSRFNGMLTTKTCEMRQKPWNCDETRRPSQQQRISFLIDIRSV